MELQLVAAIADNGVIGEGPSVPWHIPEDVRHYRQTVAGSPIIVGRRTFDAMDKLDVPRHVVLTTDESRASDDDEIVYVTSASEAAAAAAETGAETAYVIGGGEIYRLFIPYADGAILSHIHEAYEGSVTFPDLGPGYVEREREPHDEFDIVWYENTERQPLPETADS